MLPILPCYVSFGCVEVGNVVAPGGRFAAISSSRSTQANWDEVLRGPWPLSVIGRWVLEQVAPDLCGRRVFSLVAAFCPTFLVPLTPISWGWARCHTPRRTECRKGYQRGGGHRDRNPNPDHRPNHRSVVERHTWPLQNRRWVCRPLPPCDARSRPRWPLLHTYGARTDLWRYPARFVRIWHHSWYEIRPGWTCPWKSEVTCAIHWVAPKYRICRYPGRPGLIVQKAEGWKEGRHGPCRDDKPSLERIEVFVSRYGRWGGDV